MLLFGIPLVNLGYLLIIMLVVGQEEKPHDQPLPRKGLDRLFK